MLASIPEDCLLGILDVARVQDIINLRQTCKELYRITRLRTLWLAIYARLECDQNILLPPIPTPYTLSTLPLSHLETLCVSALKLHNTWTSPSYSPSPTPARLSSVVPKFEYYSGFLSDTPEPVKTTSLSPGGRFLIVFTADFSMHVVDLNTSVGHLAVTGRTLRNGYLETAGRNNAGVGGRRDVQAGFIFHEMTANIVWHNDVKASVCLQAAGAINQYPHLVCAHQEWIIEIVGRDDPEIPNAIISRAFPQTSSTNTGQPKQFATCTLRTFFPTKYSLNPRIVDASAAPLMSAYAHGIRQIHVHDCESGKGVVLCGDGPKELDHKSPVSRHYTETRIFQTDGDTYVGCVDGALTVHVYSVPRLQDQRDQQFSRVEAVPVAKDKLESACEALHIGSWHRSDSTGARGSTILSSLRFRSFYSKKTPPNDGQKQRPRSIGISSLRTHSSDSRSTLECWNSPKPKQSCQSGCRTPPFLGNDIDTGVTWATCVGPAAC
ncbi:hypothetical protein BXZ70DRAFT_946767 [Cristinia sonorae]|uniref:F-box domain-containing protein n=1 Tax=Cristinia sonorae TaxID=1940300 RepID=A0A8K0XN83_9AGAR|nr:hypothetical protein BXZ70DRAFT_946767 [Cristinia sonorae]